MDSSSSSAELPIFFALLVPSACINIGGLIITWKYYNRKKSSFNRTIFISWMLSTLYLVLFNISAWIEPCHRSDSIRSTPIAFDTCKTSWLRLATICIFALSAAMFSVSAINFCSTILDTHHVHKLAFRNLRVFLLALFVGYLFSSVLLFMAPQDSEERNIRMKINVSFLIAAVSSAIFACTVSATMAVSRIRSIKNELATLGTATEKGSLKTYIRYTIEIIIISTIIIGACYVVIFSRMSFPLSEARTLLLSICLGVMTGAQLYAIQLIKCNRELPKF